jgi:hypothetical protein
MSFLSKLEVPEASGVLIGNNTRKIVAQVMTISPEEAAVIWQSRNRLNRPIVDRIVNQYARDMAQGRWQVSGQGIIFDCQGKLVDGHHRIKACIEANVPFITLVVRNVDERAVMVQDIGAQRTAGQIAHMTGTPACSIACAAARLFLLYQKNGCATLQGGYHQPSKPEILEIVASEPVIIEAGQFGKRLAKLMNPSVGALLAFLFLKANRAAAVEFLESLIDGNDLPSDSSVFQFRSRLLNAKLLRQKLGYPMMVGLGIKAWNLFLEKKPSKRLVIDEREAWPELKA